MNTGTALGLPDTAVGIAVRPGGSFMSGRATLGGYWRVKVQGKTFVIRQIDVGPHEKTGRRFDFTAAALKKYGLKDPTDQTVTGVYLGKHKPSQMGVEIKPMKKKYISPTTSPQYTAARATFLKTGGVKNPHALLELARAKRAA